MTANKQIMKISFLAIISIAVLTGCVTAQTGSFNNLQIHSNLRLKDRTIYKISNDTAFVSADSTSLPTSWAVKNYVNNRLLTPIIATGNTFVVADQPAMLALSANVGDVAVVTDSSKSYILQATPASTLSNWILLLFPGNVNSVFGRTGTVVPEDGDYDYTQITGLAALLSNKMNYSDTASMLLPYLKSVDAFTKSQADLLYRPITYVPAWNDITGKPTFATVATSGSYNDLTSKPTIPAQFNPIAGPNMTLSGAYPNITFNATGGGGTNNPDSLGGKRYTEYMLYADSSLMLEPYLQTAIADASYKPIGYVPAWNEITGKPAFATVATSGDYNDLINKPSLANPSLQDVTTVGNSTGSNIYVVSGNDTSTISPAWINSRHFNGVNTTYNGWLTPMGLQFDINGISKIINLGKYSGIGNQTFSLPKLSSQNGTAYLPVSVNGNMADSMGNITIPVGTGNLDSSALNLSLYQDPGDTYGLYLDYLNNQGYNGLYLPSASSTAAGLLWSDGYNFINSNLYYKDDGFSHAKVSNNSGLVINGTSTTTYNHVIEPDNFDIDNLQLQFRLPSPVINGTSTTLYYLGTIKNITYADPPATNIKVIGGIPTARYGDHQTFIYEDSVWYDVQLYNYKINDSIKASQISGIIGKSQIEPDTLYFGNGLQVNGDTVNARKSYFDSLYSGAKTLQDVTDSGSITNHTITAANLNLTNIQEFSNQHAAVLGGLSNGSVFRLPADGNGNHLLAIVDSTAAGLTFTVDNSTGSYAANSLYFQASSTFSMRINWGDGSVDDYSGANNYDIHHTYATSDTFNVTMTSPNYSAITYIHLNQDATSDEKIRNLKDFSLFTNLLELDLKRINLDNINAVVMPNSIHNLDIGSNAFTSFNRSLPTSLVSFHMSYTNCTSFTATNYPSTIKTFYVNSNGPLTTTDVNNILIGLNGASVTGATINTSGNSAPPSGAGATAKSNLIAAGNTVTTD